MTLVEWRPNNTLSNYFNDIERVFDNFFIQPQSLESNINFTPTLDVVEHDLKYVVSIDIPGVDKKDIEISISNGILTVSGIRKDIVNRKDTYSTLQENLYGSFKRSIDLSSNIKEDKIKASFSNGVLIIDIPKLEEIKPSVKKIKIS